MTHRSLSRTLPSLVFVLFPILFKWQWPIILVTVIFKTMIIFIIIRSDQLRLLMAYCILTVEVAIVCLAQLFPDASEGSAVQEFLIDAMRQARCLIRCFLPLLLRFLFRPVPGLAPSLRRLRLVKLDCVT